MTPVVRLVTLAILPISLLISISHLVGASHGPGDGFTAGVISALGFTLQYVSFGYVNARRMLHRIPFQALLFVGLGLAISAFVLPAIAPTDFALPWIGSAVYVRAGVFDVGVYLVVLGGAMTAIGSLGRSIS